MSTRVAPARQMPQVRTSQLRDSQIKSSCYLEYSVDCRLFFCTCINWFFFSFFSPGGALDPGIDLLDALSLHTNLSQYQGVTVTDEYQHQRVYHLSGQNQFYLNNFLLPDSIAMSRHAMTFGCNHPGQVLYLIQIYSARNTPRNFADSSQTKSG